jgi:hypothetical protein
MRFVNVFLAVLGARVVIAGSNVPAATGDLWIGTIQNPRQCLSTDVVIAGGAGPYTISVLRGDDYATKIAVLSMGLSAPGSLSWCINIASGTSFALMVVGHVEASRFWLTQATDRLQRRNRLHCGSHR